MNTATETHSASHGHASAPAAEVAPIDPEHEIDAPKTVLWLVGALVFVVGSLIVLASVFSFSVQDARHGKVELAAPKELRELRANEAQWLNKAEAVPGSDPRTLSELEESIKESTEAVIRRYAK